MIVKNFKDNCRQYDNFQIWDIENLESFLNGNQILPEIFKKDYKMTPEELPSRRQEIPQSDIGIVDSLLDQIGDKHFFTFTKDDKNHIELILMQDTRVMSFGIDISQVQEGHMYAVIMDKLAN